MGFGGVGLRLIVGLGVFVIVRARVRATGRVEVGGPVGGVSEKVKRGGWGGGAVCGGPPRTGVEVSGVDTRVYGLRRGHDHNECDAVRETGGAVS